MDKHKQGNNYIYIFFLLGKKKEAWCPWKIAGSCFAQHKQQTKQSHASFETINVQVTCWAMQNKLYPREILEAARWEFIDNHIVFSA